MMSHSWRRDAYIERPWTQDSLDGPAFSSQDGYSPYHEGCSPGDDVAFMRGLANAILPSLALWALIFGAIAWVF